MGRLLAKSLDLKIGTGAAGQKKPVTKDGRCRTSAWLTAGTLAKS
jgi:hypothetical protein